ncbi:MAG: hypothetical protein KAJ55_09665 [Anaerolineales bacterium]|nr:hypothetical protein [Anaerolineales bacterium]
MTTLPSKPVNGAQGGLFDEADPKPNSPEDLGHVTPTPAGQVYGKPAPEPDPLPVNVCSSAIQHSDAIKFRDWIFAQELPTHARITLGGIVVGLSGLGVDDLRWLCKAIRQAGRAPSPEKLRRAVLTHDVGVLREADDD